MAQPLLVEYSSIFSLSFAFAIQLLITSVFAWAKNRKSSGKMNLGHQRLVESGLAMLVLEYRRQFREQVLEMKVRNKCK